MKTYKTIKFIVVGVSLFVCGIVLADTAYVSSLKAKLHSDSNAGAAVVSELNRGQALNVVNDNGAWLQVTAGAQKGWIKKMFTNSSKPGAKFSILGNASENARIHARKRASSNVTAASARGLDDDSAATGNGRQRELDKKTGAFDPRALEDMESRIISERTLILFLQEGHLQ